MRNWKKAIIYVGFSLLIFGFVPFGAAGMSTEPNHILTRAKHIQIPFVENRGQLLDDGIKYYADTFACRFAVTGKGKLVYSPKGGREQAHTFEEFPSGAEISMIAGKGKVPTTVNYFRGEKPENWAVNLAAYNLIDLGEIYPNIGLTLRAHGNNVEKLFHIRPEGKVEQIRMTVKDAEKLSVAADGRLKIETASGVIRFSKPVAYQQIDGRKQQVPVAYRVNDHGYGFTVGKYDPAEELVIDPLIDAYLIGSQDDEGSRGTCMEIDSAGHVYVGGYSGNDFWVWKFDPTIEALVEFTYFGGSNSDSEDSIRALVDMAIDSRDNVFVVGRTEIDQIPVTQGAFGPSRNGYWDGFVVKFDADLTLSAATYIGGGGIDEVNAIAVDRNDEIYIAGEAADAEHFDVKFPMLPTGYNTQYTPDSPIIHRAFVLKLDNSLETLLASTFICNPTGDSSVVALAIDSAGDIIAAGQTDSSDFPLTQGALDSTFSGETEAFIVKFDPTLQRLGAATFLGGSNEDELTALAVDPENNIFAAGWAESPDFPMTADGFSPEYHLKQDGVILKLSSDLQQLLDATFIGGEDDDAVYDINLRDDGAVVMTGQTESEGFPTTPDAHDITSEGIYSDIFVTVMDSTLKELHYSTCLGGTYEFAHEAGYGVRANGDDLYVTGWTRSPDFPFISEEQSEYDTPLMFIARFNPNETSPLQSDPPPVGRWTSPKNVSVSWGVVYLDIDISSDGSFSGTLHAYSCLLNVMTNLWNCEYEEEDNDTGDTVSGNLDFKTGSGVMIWNDCENIPVKARRTSLESFTLTIDGGSAPCLDMDDDFYAYLNLNGPADGSGGNGAATDSESKGGGGGGCFIGTVGQ